jgi:uncharacterized transporter YbjL
MKIEYDKNEIINFVLNFVLFIFSVGVTIKNNFNNIPNEIIK